METGNPQSLVGPNDTVVFNDYDDDNNYGGVFKIERITGADGAAIRAPAESRPQRDGAILHPFYRDGRAFTLEGRIVPDSPTARREMEDLLKTVTQQMLRSDGTYEWEPSPGGSATTREIICRLHEPVEISDEDSAIKTFVIPLYSQDPYARALGAHSVAGTQYAPAGSAIIVNAGNAPYWPVIYVYGPLTTFTLTNHTTNPDDPFAAETEVHWDGNGHTIANGDFAVLQMDFERLNLDSDGSSELRYIVFADTDFWPLWPGDNFIEFNASGIGGATKAVVFAYDGWV